MSDCKHTTIVFSGAHTIGGEAVLDGRPAMAEEGCFYNALEKIEELEAKLTQGKELIQDLIESAEYWGEYDVPIGIVDRMKDFLGEKTNE